MPFTAYVLCWRGAPTCPLEGLLCYMAWCTYYAPPVLQGLFTAPCTGIYAGDLYRCATIYLVAAAGNIPPFMFPSNVSASAFSCGASFPACSCTLWFREHGGGALHPSGNCAGSWLWSRCRKHIAWPRAAGLAAFRRSWRCCRGRWRPRHGFLAFRSWRSDCRRGSTSTLVASGWRRDWCCLARRVDALNRRCRLVCALALVSPVRIVEM